MTAQTMLVWEDGQAEVVPGEAVEALTKRGETPTVRVHLGVASDGPVQERALLAYQLGGEINERATAMTAVITKGSYLQVTGLAAFEMDSDLITECMATTRWVKKGKTS